MLSTLTSNGKNQTQPIKFGANYTEKNCRLKYSRTSRINSLNTLEIS